MIESIFTPSHPNPLKALLNEPLASTLNHATAERTSLFFKLLIANVLMVGLEIALHLYQSLQVFALSDICIDQCGQGSQYSLMLPMPE